MSVLSIDWINALPFAVLGVSLLGSGHCVAMCGGLILSSAKTPLEVVFYHLGRLLGYSLLGAIAGLVGSRFLNSETFAIFPWVSSILIAISFIFIGVRTWQQRPVHLFRLPSRFFSRFSNTFGTSAFSTGLLSAALPCGWLHGFVLGAIATQSVSLGVMYLFFFWIGTLPALTLAPVTIRKIFAPIAEKAPKVSAVLFVSIGLLSLGVKLKPLMSAQDSCPMHSDQAMHH